ncbi:geranylgeranyl reductase family protein [Sagittula sp. SSi028]|uniref:geranylgeranyl reductase family protein n=1 Tax=Sagittula sp. SSi028 TaxID=3400636 RepID=UPI003AF843BC
MVRYDLVVVGAGPAGSAAAAIAAKSGLKTALVDKKRFPRDKLCGGGLTVRATQIFSEIFDETLPAIDMEVRDSFEFYAFGEALGTERKAPPIHLCMRRDLDAYLLDRAIQFGADTYTGQTIEVVPDKLLVRVGEITISAQTIIAADGVNSPTAKTLFGTAFDRKTIGFALEVERPVPGANTPLRIDFGAAEWGYGWQFPKTKTITIGLGGLMSENASMKSALSDYLERLGCKEDVTVKGQFLPFGTFRSVPGRGRVLLVGDAAGLVDPITGEGIGYAMHSGRLAAEAAVQALTCGQADKALPIYRKSLRPIHKELRQARLLRQLMFRKALRQTFVRGFKNSKFLKRMFLQLLAGETTYTNILYRMLLRLPRLALRAIIAR